MGCGGAGETLESLNKTFADCSQFMGGVARS
jgi:hypothetical protein